MKSWFVPAALLILSIIFLPKGAPVTPTVERPLILAFGDSLTYGFGTAHPERESYPARLEALTGQPVVNAGVNGETSAEGLRRIDRLLERHRPGLTLLCLGGNDLLRGLPRDRLKQNLRQILEKIRDSGSAVLLIAVPDLGILGLRDLSLYEELAEEEQVPLLDGVLGPILGDPTLKSDSIHPNAEGYRILAEKIYEKLRDEGLLYEKGNN